MDTLLGETLNSQSLQNTAPRAGVTFNVTRSSAIYGSYATSFFPVVTNRCGGSLRVDRYTPPACVLPSLPPLQSLRPAAAGRSAAGQRQHPV